VSAPKVSVVVATHDRIELLPRVVRALEHEPGAADLELVVVDDASSDGTWEMLETIARESPLPVRPMRMPHNVGPAAARNAGWRAASAPLIAFTDDDCIPQPGWVAAIVAGLDQADLVQGVTLPDPAQADKRGPFSRWMEMRTEEGFYPTCNMGYRREVLEVIGGFDEGFRHPYGEDTDLAWRAKEVGFSSALAADAVVFHEMWPSNYMAYARDARRREGMVMAMSRHPGLRRRLGKGVFLWRRHPPAIAQLGALVFLAGDPRSPRRWTAALAAGAWYAWICRREHPKPRSKAGWAAVVPLSLAADVYEIGVLAAASVRYRTLLL
jgi:GT2 family glycosyltransferase